MNNNIEQMPQGQEARLPQIDPVTFSALNTLDHLIGKAALTRQEHAEANKSLQHVVQTIEMLQGVVRELNQRQNCRRESGAPAGPTERGAPGVRPLPFGNGAAAETREADGNGSRIVAEVAEEIFRNLGSK